MSSKYHNRLIWIKNLFLKWIAFAFQVLVEDFFYIRKKSIDNAKTIQSIDNIKCIRPDNAKCVSIFFYLSPTNAKFISLVGENASIPLNLIERS